MAAPAGEYGALALKKLLAILLLFAGLAFTAVGFNGGSVGTTLLGLALIAASVLLLILKIVRRSSLP
ncbi:hypothetical protein [Flaviflagellibacter deserti]|uniref:DUF1328 domain-containing protein n=1 Tax=Flaviflagellibacter deserti TaxID=2267266 RepID=A0ABV9Z518_9HYPH